MDGASCSDWNIELWLDDNVGERCRPYIANVSRSFGSCRVGVKGRNADIPSFSANITRLLDTFHVTKERQREALRSAVPPTAAVGQLGGSAGIQTVLTLLHAFAFGPGPVISFVLSKKPCSREILPHQTTL